MLTKEILEELYYRQSLSTSQIAERLGCSRRTVRYWMERYDLNRRSISDANFAYYGSAPLSSGQIDDISWRYKNGESRATLAQAYGVSGNTIKRILVRRGVKLYSWSESHRTFALNEMAFDVLTEESAYWIGMLMADGNVHHYKRPGNSPSISLTLKESDRSHLERFRAFLGSTHTLEVRPAMASICLRVASTRLAEVLAGYGVVPRKSLVATVVGLEDNRDFWRGVIDGDGHLSINREGKPILQLAGAKPLLGQFARFVHQHIPNCAATVRPNENIATVVVGGRFAVQLIHHLYVDCAVALPRKLKIANEILSRFPFISPASQIKKQT